VNVVGNVSAAIAAVAALGALYLARQTVREARATRQEAERDSRRHRLERVGELVESVYWAAEQDRRYTPPTSSFVGPRHQLRQALIGIGDSLPRCTDIVTTRSAPEAQAAAELARPEIDAALRDIPA
jgi:hypothetical protein